MNHKLNVTVTLSLLTALWSCGKIKDALTEGPQRSICRAYCDWAVECQAQAREVDREALLEQCLASTQGQDPDCVTSETEGFNLVKSKVFAECVEAIDEVASSMDCSPFTGDTIEINSATPPQSCVGVGDIDLFNTSRASTAETNDELCGRVSETLCERSSSCLVERFNIPEEVLEMIDPSAFEQCVSRFEEDVTSTCRDEQLYALDQMQDAKADIDTDYEPELPSVFFSVNPNREAARACLTELAMLPCDQLFGAELPPVCVGAFSEPTAAAGALNGFACGLERDELASICGE